MKNAITALCVTLCLAVPAAAAPDEQATAGVASTAASSKELKARELLTLMKASDIAMQGVEGMMGAMKDAMPQVSEDFWTAFKAEIDAEELLELLVPIYVENFEESDLDGLIAFYQSPVGKRYIDKQGLILQQSMLAGQKWGGMLADRAIRQLNAGKNE